MAVPRQAFHSKSAQPIEKFVTDIDELGKDLLLVSWHGATKRPAQCGGSGVMQLLFQVAPVGPWKTQDCSAPLGWLSAPGVLVVPMWKFPP